MGDSEHSRPRHELKALALALGATVILALIVGAGAFFWSELEQTKADNAALAQQVRALGGTPTVTPAPVKGISSDAVRAIVTDELSRYKVTLTQDQVSQIATAAASLVPKPKDGTTPTATQVQGVVSATIKTFCAQDSKPCTGKDGKDGPKGKDAPPITAAQLRDAVAAFCGEDAVNCQGKPGAAGAPGRGIASITKSGSTVTVTYTDDTTGTFTVLDGQAGPAGRGIAKTECQDDGDWLFTYTDGTAETVGGPCRVQQPPLPTDLSK